MTISFRFLIFIFLQFLTVLNSYSTKTQYPSRSELRPRIEKAIINSDLEELNFLLPLFNSIERRDPHRSDYGKELEDLKTKAIQEREFIERVWNRLNENKKRSCGFRELIVLKKNLTSGECFFKHNLFLSNYAISIVHAREIENRLAKHRILYLE